MLSPGNNKACHKRTQRSGETYQRYTIGNTGCQRQDNQQKRFFVAVRFQTASNIGGMTHLETTSTTTIKSKAFTKAKTIAPRLPPASPSMGTSNTRMTTAMSWKIRKGDRNLAGR